MKKLIVFLIFTSLVVLVFASLFSINQISGKGMEPTFKDGQNIIFRKPYLGGIKRGDVVLYSLSNQNNPGLAPQIGRIVGMPTESVNIENGNLYIDNNINKLKLIEDYVDSVKTKAYDEGQWLRVGEFEYFILPDNRDGVISMPSKLIHKNDIQAVFLNKF